MRASRHNPASCRVSPFACRFRSQRASGRVSAVTSWKRSGRSVESGFQVRNTTAHLGTVTRRGKLKFIGDIDREDLPRRGIAQNDYARVTPNGS